MALDIHRIRQICRDRLRLIVDQRRELGRNLSAFQSMGSVFTSDPLFAKEYGALKRAVEEAERAYDKVRDAVHAIEKKVS